MRLINNDEANVDVKFEGRITPWGGSFFSKCEKRSLDR